MEKFLNSFGDEFKLVFFLFQFEILFYVCNANKRKVRALVEWHIRWESHF